MTEKETLVKEKKPTFDYFSAKNFSNVETTTPTVKKEVERFKKNYDSSKLERVYEKYELLEEEENFEEAQTSSNQTFENKPLINNDFNKILRSQTKFDEASEEITLKSTLKEEKVKLELNSKTKLTVFTYAFVAIMLGFLLIYNAFAIGSARSNINNLNNNISAEQVRIDRVIKDIGNMTDEDNIMNIANDLSFGQIPQENIINVNLYEKQTPITYEGQTNWFDKVCSFIKGLFGG